MYNGDFFTSNWLVLPTPLETLTGCSGSVQSTSKEGSSTMHPAVQLRYRPSPPGVTDGSYRICRRYEKNPFYSHPYNLEDAVWRYATHPSLESKSISKPIYIFSYNTRATCRFGRGCIYAHSPDELKEWQQEYDRKRKEKLRKELEEQEEIGSLELASEILKGPAKDVSQ